MTAALRRAAAVVCAAPALWHLALVIRLFLARVGHPFDLEWLESTFLYQAYRMGHGLPSYVPPWEGTLPLLQPPFHPLLLGAIGRVVGLGYVTGRTLSFVAFAGAAAIVAAVVRRHAGSWVAAALAVGIAAAGDPLIKGFYDLVRCDALAVFLWIAPAALAGTGAFTRRRLVCIALLLTAAVYTRLTTVFPVGWVVVWVLLRDRRAGATLALFTATLGVAILVALELATRGWFWVWALGLHQTHRIIPSSVLLGWSRLVLWAPFLPAVPVVAVVLGVRRRLSGAGLLWTGLLVAALPAALFPFAKMGGFSNDLMPVAFVLGPATLVVAADVIAVLPRARWPIFGLLALWLALALRSWDSGKLIPSPEMREGARAVNALVAGLDGDVLSPHGPMLPVLNGKTTPQITDMTYWDVVQAHWPEGAVDLGAWLDRVGARWVIVSGNEIPWTARELAKRYRIDRAIPSPPRTVTGVPSSPAWLLRRRDPDPTDAVSVKTGAPFAVERGHISVWVRPAGKATLEVDGRPAMTAVNPYQRADAPALETLWDMSALLGKSARLVGNVERAAAF